MSDALVAALGRLSEALEVVEEARGRLYGFHRLSGHADLTLQDAVRQLRAAGRPDIADRVERQLVGRDTSGDGWTFELVERYDAKYWQPFRDAEAWARAELDAPRHLFEAEMKRAEQHPEGQA